MTESPLGRPSHPDFTRIPDPGLSSASTSPPLYWVLATREVLYGRHARRKPLSLLSAGPSLASRPVPGTRTEDPEASDRRPRGRGQKTQRHWAEGPEASDRGPRGIGQRPRNIGQRAQKHRTEGLSTPHPLSALTQTLTSLDSLTAFGSLSSSPLPCNHVVTLLLKDLQWLSPAPHPLVHQ